MKWLAILILAVNASALEVRSPSPNSGTITPGAITVGTATVTGSATVAYGLTAQNISISTSATALPALYINPANGEIQINGSTVAAQSVEVRINFDPSIRAGTEWWNRSTKRTSALMDTVANDADFKLYNAAGTLGIRLIGGSSLNSYINNGANFGIGTASPGSLLTVSNDTFTVTSAGIVSAPSQPFVRAIDPGQLTNAWTTLFFNTPAADNDRGGMFGGTSSSGTFTTNGAGQYEACVTVLPNSTTNPGLRFTLNGTPANDRSKYFASVTGNQSISYCEKMILASGVAVQAEFYGSSGSSTQAGYGSFTMAKIW